MNYRNCCSFFNANMVLALQPPQGAADEGLRPQQRRSIFITNPFITNEGLDLLARLLSEDPRNKRTLPPLNPRFWLSPRGCRAGGLVTPAHKLSGSADCAGTTSPSSNEPEDVLADVAELLAAC